MSNPFSLFFFSLVRSRSLHLSKWINHSRSKIDGTHKKNIYGRCHSDKKWINNKEIADKAKMNLRRHHVRRIWINFQKVKRRIKKDVDGCRRMLSISIGQRKVKRQQQRQQHLIDLGRDLRKNERKRGENDTTKKNCCHFTHFEFHTHCRLTPPPKKNYLPDRLLTD